MAYHLRMVRRARNTLPQPATSAMETSLDDFGVLLGAIYQGILDSTALNTLLEQLRRILGAKFATIVMVPPAPDREATMVHAEKGLVQAQALYSQRFYTIDPFLSLPPDRVITVDDLLDTASWEANAYYQQFLRPMDVRHVMGADITTPEGTECRLRLCRPHDAAPFSPADKAFCTLLLPHIRRAMQIHGRIDTLATERHLYAGTVDRLLVGTVILDSTGRILSCNDPAATLLAEGDGIIRTGDALHAGLPGENSEFQRLLEQAVRGHRGCGGQVVEATALTRRRRGTRLGILVRSLPVLPGTEAAREPAAVVFIRDPERKAQASHEVLRQLFDFTPAEATLAALLAEGLSVEDTAEQLGVSINTARTHVRALLTKTGTTRQPALVNLLHSSIVPFLA
ncbi:MAG: helix-turn-helix transcriptional regulator [Proteobacteria bacterium]|nr:helix-turn-helix transcriptional regulator [Pseudomonadota bacterium]HQR02721.1 LuxR C-terminal-related transcriptional regulator [Rhodocyclaceae bacterium]